MEYPNTKFSHKVRLAMLALFILAFFIIAPLVIMYTAGYHYDWHYRVKKFTGAISVDVEPKNASVYLNNTKIKGGMPVRLNSILPDKYNLRISAPGYFDWSKEIEVKENQTNYTKEIGLIKNNQPGSLIPGRIDNFALSYDGKYILYTTQTKTSSSPAIAQAKTKVIAENTSTTVWLWNKSTKQSTELYSLDGIKPLNLTWAENNDYAVVADSPAPYSHLLIIDAASPSSNQNLVAKDKDKNDKPLPIQKFELGASSEPQLYYSTKENIYLYPIFTGGDHQFVAKNDYLDWYMDNGQLWTLQLNTSTKQYDIVRDTLFNNSVFNSLDSTDVNLATGQTEAETLQILSARQNTVLLQDRQNSQMILVAASNKPQPNKYKLSADKFLISKYNNWWLIWSQWEMWTYVEGEEPVLLNRSGEHLQQVLPLDKYNTLAFVWADKTTALFPYYLVNQDLLNEKITNAAADTDNRILYFTNQNKDGIWTLNY